MHIEDFNDKEIINKLFIKEKLPKKCSLCNNGDLNINGHIIPELILRWVRRKSGKKNFFFSTIQNDFLEALEKLIRDNNGMALAVSDLMKYRMLCDNCELHLSIYEKKFTDTYFKKYYRGHSVGELDDNTYFLIVSIAWRVLISSQLMVGQEQLESISFLFQKSMKSTIIPKPTKPTEPTEPTEPTDLIEVSYFTIEDVESIIDEKHINQSALRYSISQNIFAHDIFSRISPRTLIKLSIIKEPIILLKLGRYYFLINMENYFLGSEYVIEREIISAKNKFYKIKINDDVLSLVKIIGGNKFSGIDGYEFKEIKFETRILSSVRSHK